MVVTNCRLFGYYYKTCQWLDVPPIPANKRFKIGSGVIVDFSGLEVRWLQEINFISITIGQFEWLKAGVASVSGNRPEIVIIDPPVLDDLGLLFRRCARYTKDVCTTKPELQKEQGLFKDELPGLESTVPTDSLGLELFQ